jgi:hypothetical protein
MKKHIFTVTVVAAVASLIFFACKKKKDDTITPTYKSEGTGTGSNPNPNNVTVTGTTNTNTPATNNSNLNVGGAGWSNPSCITTNSLYVKGINGSTEVTLQFANPPAVGTQTYFIASSPGVNSCALTVTGEPNQPAGTVWYGYEGTVSVLTTTNSVGVSIMGSIKCRQSSFNFPIVTVTGNLGCY